MRSFYAIFSILLTITMKNLGCSSTYDEKLADPETTTPKNCTCASECKGILPLYERDVCYTENKCGQSDIYSGFQYYDYCNYLDKFKPNNLRKNWEEKTNDLWKLIKDSDKSIGEIFPLDKLFYSSIRTPFENEWDVLPKGRVKAVHSVGAVCKFEFEIANSFYTGLLKNGMRRGIMRLGSTTDVSDNKGVKPGIAVKLLRTNRSSGNFFLMNTLDVIETYDFFSVPVFTHIKPSQPKGPGAWEVAEARKAGIKKFEQASNCTKRIGLSDLARYDQDGDEIDLKDVRFPFQITFNPTGEVHFKNESSNLEEFSKQWKEIKDKAALYTVIAHDNPNDLFPNGTTLGTIIVDGGCTTSKFGDKRLHFRHRRIEDDIQFKPEWKNDYMTDCD